MDAGVAVLADNRKGTTRNNDARQRVVGTPRRKAKTPQNFRSAGFLNLAERVGFEPTVRENRTPDFESGTFDHSATFPGIPTCCFVGSKRAVAWEKKIIEQFDLVFQAPRRKNF
jgi:hypothetical protein